MPDLDLSDPQIQAILGIGGLDEQQQRLQQQRQLAQALRNQPMGEHTTGLGGALGALGHILGTAGSYAQEGRIQGQENALRQQRQAALKSYTGLLGGGVDTSAYQGEGSATPEQGQALMQAIRRQRALAALGTASGDPALAALGKSAMAEADRAEGAPQTQLQRALEAQKLSNEKATAAKAARPATTFSKSLLGKMAPGVDLGDAQEQDVEKMLPAVAAYSAKEDAAKQRALTARLAEGDATGGLSPEALDMLAEQFAATGKMPGLGMGKKATALRARIATRAAELHPGTNLAGNASGYGADSGAQKKLQAQASAINAFEGTALRNLETFMQQAGQVVDFRSPLFNAPARKFEEAVAGDPKMAAFNAARRVAVAEISKVLSGSMGSAVVSDSARKEASDLIGPNASLAQLKAAAEILRTDMEARKSSMAAEIETIQRRISGGAGQQAAAPAPAATPMPAPAAPPAGLTPEQFKRLQELRAKKAAGTLQ